MGERREQISRIRKPGLRGIGFRQIDERLRFQASTQHGSRKTVRTEVGRDA
jgi:hypothetical protein